MNKRVFALFRATIPHQNSEDASSGEGIHFPFKPAAKLIGNNDLFF